MATERVRLSEDDVVKARIIKHMNQQHTDSLALILRHQRPRLSSLRARHATLHDVSLVDLQLLIPRSNIIALLPTSLIPAYFLTNITLPITPEPMVEWSEARTVYKEMDQEARQKLNCSPDTISRYTTPDTALSWTLMILTIGTLIVFSHPANLAPDTFVGGAVTYYLSRMLQVILGDEEKAVDFAIAFGHFCRIIRPWLVLFIVSVHAAEAYWMATTRLRKHVVMVGSFNWWAWMLDVFFEGFGAFIRFDALVRKAQAARKKS